MKITISPLITAMLFLVSCAPQEEAPEQLPTATIPPITRFVESPGMDRDAAWSPDGRWIAFGSTDEDIWIKSVETGETIQLTSGPDVDTYPTWSPDGKEIAFTSNRGGPGNVWTVPAAGGRPRQVTAAADSVSLQSSGGTIVAWSPDGREIAFTSVKGDNADIWIIPAEGGTARQLTTSPASDIAPDWSPDGQQIAFTSARSGNRDIWIIPAQGGTARQLTTNQTTDAVPRWSPDGEWIAFQSSRSSGIQGIWIIPVKGGRPLQATDISGGILSVPSWSPDGKKIACNGGAWISEIWMMPTGGEPHLVTAIGIGHPYGRATWSPDGKHVVFGRQVPEGFDIWTLTLESGEKKPLTSGGLASGRPGPVYSPDGGRIAFFSTRRRSGEDGGWGDWSIWTMPVDGSKPAWLAEGYMPAWSPDGSRLIYSQNGDLWTIPAGGGTPSPVLENAQQKFWPSWSPDGEQILYMHRQSVSDIWIVDVSGLLASR